MSKILSARDLNFLLFEWLDVEALTSRDRFKDHSAETFDAFLELSEQLATKEFASHNALNDQNEPTFDGERVHIISEVKHALDAFNVAGLTAAAMDEEVGGVQLPNTVQRACFMWFQAANAGTAGYPLLTTGTANLLRAHASADLIERFVPPMADGRYFGTMCLSEPDVGSSLGDVTTRAVPQSDGTHRIFGTKMWISGGEHELSENIVALVLARHEGGPAGVPGLSLYLVPKFMTSDDGLLGERNAITLVGINHKMGYRGTVNTVLEFGGDLRQPGGEAGAVGYLIGEEGQGLAYMFHMMNEARIAVGAGAAALGYTSYLHALDYARNRPQGRLGKRADPTTPMVPIVHHADVRRMLLASKSYAEGAVALVLYAARLLDEEQTAETVDELAEAALLLDVLTPIVKSWPCQWGLVANDLAIQIHGGYGYTREFPVEQFYRDNRLNPIHEGTHGIHGKDLLGRKVAMKDGEGLRLLLTRMRTTVDRALAEEAATLQQWGHALASLCDRIESVTATLLEIPDTEARLANASIYLEAVGHAVVAWLWLDVAITAAPGTASFYEGKRLAASYFFDYELPKVAPMLDLLISGSRLLVELDEASL